jgi:hypothetical protein
MSADVVCILDSTLTQVFERARPIKADVREEAKLMEHPLETGTTITDHLVLQPLEILLSLVVTGAEYAATYQQIREYFKRAELLTVQTLTGSYPDMVISQMPHDESPETVNAVNIGLSLRQATFVTATFSALKVRHAKDGNTSKGGEQQPQTPKKQPSVLSGIFR